MCESNKRLKKKWLKNCLKLDGIMVEKMSEKLLKSEPKMSD